MVGSWACLDDTAAKRFTATVPSVGDVVEALNDLCACLTIAFKNITDLSAELAARDSIRVDSITQVQYYKSSQRRELSISRSSTQGRLRSCRTSTWRRNGPL